MQARVRALLRVFGKGDSKVAAVFANSADDCHAAVVHLRAGAPEVPVWVFSTVPLLATTADLCAAVYVQPGSLALVLRAWRLLWPRWVALSVGPWTGGHGDWPLKLAPFCVPFFRALLINRQGDFFAGTPTGILAHNARNLHDGLLAVWAGLRAAGRFIRDRLANLGHRLASLARSAWLLLLLLTGNLLRLAGYPHHRLFQAWQGNAPLHPRFSESEGGGVAVFVQSGTIWKGRELEALARTSSARWILWRQEPASAASFDKFLPLFNRQETFALSLQQHFRAWKPMLFPVAPFRSLQPGEAAPVLAPVSPAILVDRRKLLELGIPRTSLPGTAWRILFWKAAAAGWRSYSIGTGAALTEQPDAPIQETAFLVRLLGSRSLRRLGPREPNLARGAASFSVHSLAPRQHPGRLHVLLVSPFLPFPLSHGGAVRIWNLCQQLADRVDFTLVAIREKDEPVDYTRLQEVFNAVHIVDIDQPASRDAALPSQVRQYQSQALRALLAELVSRRRPDLIQIEYTHMAAFRDAVPDVPAILVEHDITFSLYRQLAQNKPGPEASAEYQRWLDFERHWLSVYDGVWTVSEDDRESALRESERIREATFNVPNGVDIYRFYPAPEPAGPPEILYVGSFRHLPNVLGLEKLLSEVMPRVWKRWPEARLRVVGGPQHEKHWRQSSSRPLDTLDSRVEIHDFVADVRPLYDRASVVAVPLEVSAGTNIKVLEAMACGRAVVSTPVGCAGLGLRDGYDALIRDDWSSFADAICKLVNEKGLRASLALAARDTVEARFSWAAIADAAYRSYEQVAAPVLPVDANSFRARQLSLGD